MANKANTATLANNHVIHSGTYIYGNGTSWGPIGQLDYSNYTPINITSNYDYSYSYKTISEEQHRIMGVKDKLVEMLIASKLSKVEFSHIWGMITSVDSEVVNLGEILMQELESGNVKSELKSNK